MQVFSTAWRRCGFDSMILPTTQKFMINHLGFFYVLKYPQKVWGAVYPHAVFFRRMLCSWCVVY